MPRKYNKGNPSTKGYRYVTGFWYRGKSWQVFADDSSLPESMPIKIFVKGGIYDIKAVYNLLYTSSANGCLHGPDIPEFTRNFPHWLDETIEDICMFICNLSKSQK